MTVVKYRRKMGRKAKSLCPLLESFSAGSCAHGEPSRDVGVTYGGVWALRERYQ